ncbi:MAG: glycoside hydrolase family 3 protein [Acidobacteria bacterium]|nr:glycoside hydrolase family 3 protein [Acidobacteriota bacterium]
MARGARPRPILGQAPSPYPMWESSHLTDAERIGQLLFIGIPGHALTEETISFLHEVRPGGIILFQRNIVSRDQLQRLCRRLMGLLPIPPFLAIDQEGGRVNRLQPILSAQPSGYDLAEFGDARLVEKYARGIGDCLRLLGLHMNFAPVLDLSGRDAPNGIGDRSFGTDPERVGVLGEAFLLALKRSRILGTMKHFPGLGGAVIDSHLELPEIRKGHRKLREEDLHPFRRLAPIAPVAMMSHAWYPSLSGKEPLPASLSPHIVQDLLLGELKFPGLVLTDDLEMGSIDPRPGLGEVAVRAVAAGNDMVLVCRSKRLIRAAARGLLDAGRRGSLSQDRMDRSLGKILSLKRRFLQGRAEDSSARSFHRAASEVARVRDRIEAARSEALRGRGQGASRPVRTRKISR